MTITTQIPEVHARKTRDGVAVYADASMAGLCLHAWKVWQAGCPDGRQRYCTIEGRSFRILWHRVN